MACTTFSLFGKPRAGYFTHWILAFDAEIASFCRVNKKESHLPKSILIELLIRSLLKKRNWSQAALTAQPRRAMHGSPCKLRLSFCGSSEKSPLAIALMAGASAGLADGISAECFSW